MADQADVRMTELEVFGNELKEAMNGVFPSGTPYKEVFVILMYWSTTPTEQVELYEAIDCFETLLTEKYHFRCFRVILDCSLATNALGRKSTMDLLQVLKLVTDDDLMIYYYGGHGRLGPGNDLIIQSNKINGWVREQSLNRIFISVYFKGLPCDAIVFLDSCYSGRVGSEMDHEMITSCAAESEPEGNSLNFTRHLVEFLDDQYPVPITVAHLHAKMFKTLSVPQGSNIGLPKSPFHLELNPNQKRSLVIAPLNKPAGSTYASLPPRDVVLLGEDSPKVLTSVHLSSNTPVPNVQDWKRWLSTRIPPFIRDIDIGLEGVFGSRSVVLTLTIPLAVCNILVRAGRGYRVIGVVESRNLLLPAPPAPQAQRALPFQPKKEKINPNTSERTSSDLSLERR